VWWASYGSSVEREEKLWVAALLGSSKATPSRADGRCEVVIECFPLASRAGARKGGVFLAAFRRHPCVWVAAAGARLQVPPLGPSKRPWCHGPMQHHHAVRGSGRNVINEQAVHSRTPTRGEPAVPACHSPPIALIPLHFAMAGPGDAVCDRPAHLCFPLSLAPLRLVTPGAGARGEGSESLHSPCTACKYVCRCVCTACTQATQAPSEAPAAQRARGESSFEVELCPANQDKRAGVLILPCACLLRHRSGQ
jgi:hypothetical protein